MEDTLAARRRWWLRALSILLALGLVGGGVLALPALGVAASYSAKMVCSCVFVAGRAAEACHARDLPDLGWIDVSVDTALREVRTSALGLRSARARHVDGFGCTLE
jgi:hypothetical protein